MSGDLPAPDPDRYPPIADYGLLSDCHSWALVSRTGDIDWACFYRGGQHAVFARLLDWDRGGSLRLRPTDATGSQRRYLPETNVLETRWTTTSGTATVTDCLTMGVDPDAQTPAGIEPHDQLLRVVHCEQGEVEVVATIEPGFDYGRAPHVRVDSPGRAVATGGSHGLVIDTDLTLQGQGWQACRGTRTLRAGERAYLSARYVQPDRFAAEPADPDWSPATRLDDTIGFWRDWATRCTYDGPHRDAVVRSALVLKALTDAQTGAIVAAPTTSLPESPGGGGNWDYRFVWLRDAALHLEALFGLGYETEAHAFMGWLARTTAGSAADLQPLYGSRGQRLLGEMELSHLDGYRSSRPVRVGNAAAGQFQLDAYGELLETAWRYHLHGGQLSGELAHLLADAAHTTARIWQDPDHGMWESRGAPQHFVSSKVLAWVAIDRGIRLAEQLGDDLDVASLEDARERLRTDIEAHGTDEDGAFVRTYGSREPDASSLLALLRDFVAADDTRAQATIALVERELLDGALVRRYHGDDAGFVLCTFWLVAARAVSGDAARARELFTQLLDCRNDLGLLAEMVDPASGDLRGNFPQAISHAGLITAALRLDGSEAADNHVVDDDSTNGG